MVDAGMERHEQLQSLPFLGEQNDENIILKENIETEKRLAAVFFHFSMCCSRVSLSSCVGPLSLPNANIEQTSLGDPHSPHQMI